MDSNEAKDINGKLDQIISSQATINTIVTDLALLKQTCASRGKMLSDLYTDLNGNGKPGIKQILHDHNRVFERMAGVGRFGTPIVQRLITLAIVAVLAGMWSIYQDHKMDQFADRVMKQVDPNSR